MINLKLMPPTPKFNFQMLPGTRQDTGMRCIVATLGFDPANVLRPLLTIGTQPGDKLILVTSSLGGSYERERTRKAIHEIEAITGKKPIVLGYRATIEDLPELTRSLARECDKAEELIALLSGGLRPLILLTLSAAMIAWKHLSRNVKIVSTREDGLATLEMEPHHFSPPELSEKEAKVLQTLAAHNGEMRRRDLVKHLMREWGTSHVVVYKRLNNLERKELIRIEGNRVKLLPLGRAILEATHLDS